MDIQELLLEAANMATRAALSGNPIIGIAWIPPQNAGDSYRGLWVVENLNDRPLGGADTPPWEN